MPKEMRLIDAEAMAGVLEKYRDTYSRKQDGRAVRMLDWVLSLIDEAPTLTVHVEVPTKRTGKKAEPKHKYGQYKNVLLSDAELDKLREEFPHDWEARIEAVSDYVAANGKKYKNFLAVIRNWARREGEERAAEGKPESSFETDEFAALAMARSYGGKS